MMPTPLQERMRLYFRVVAIVAIVCMIGLFLTPFEARSSDFF